MTTATSSRISFENVAELLEDLGGISPMRVRLRPPPGRAREKDVIALHDRENRLFELVDGTLVEKAMGFLEAFLASEILGELRTFVLPRDPGIVVGADGMVQLTEGLVRIPDVAFFSWDRLPGRQIPRAAHPEPGTRSRCGGA